MVSPHSKVGKVWHTDIFPSATRKALDFLATQRWLKNSKWYLAGGTALALQVGHRSSVDLDFFTKQYNFQTKTLLKKFPGHLWTTDVLQEGTVYGKLLQAKVSFIAYPFFVPLEPFKWYGAVAVLDHKDIAVMKVIAISQRGTKRDFVDLYWYCNNAEPLEYIVERLPVQYPSVAHNYHHILKSLTYFADADTDPMPKIFFKASWQEIKKFFRKEVIRVTRQFLGLK